MGGRFKGRPQEVNSFLKKRGLYSPIGERLCFLITENNDLEYLEESYLV